MIPPLLRRRAVWLVAKIGRPGAAGIALLLAAAAYAGVVARSLPAENERLNRGIADAAAKLSPMPGRDTAPDPARQLAEFYERFPKTAAMPDVLARIVATARDQELALDAGEYAMTQLRSDSRLDRYRIAFPLKGGYPQIRRFVAAALAAAPSMALESIAFKRDRVSDDIVEARVVFLLYLVRET